MGGTSQSHCGGGGTRWQDHDAGSAPALSADGGGIPFVAACIRGPRPARPASDARSAIPRAPAPAKSQVAPMINGRLAPRLSRCGVVARQAMSRISPYIVLDLLALIPTPEIFAA